MTPMRTMLRRALNPSLAAQAMLIKVSANLVVQIVKRIHHETVVVGSKTLAGQNAGLAPKSSSSAYSPGFDLRQIAEFALYGLVGSQINNIIQFLLEDWFPTRGGHGHGRSGSGGVGGNVSSPHKSSRISHAKTSSDSGALLLPLPATATSTHLPLSSHDHDIPSPSVNLNGHANPFTLPSLSSTSFSSTMPTIKEKPVVINLIDGSTHPSRIVRNNVQILDSGIRWRNVLCKLLLDQTLGLYISGSIFLICTNFSRVENLAALNVLVQTHIFAVMKAGWHIWPLVAICNFLWVPVRSRVLVAVFVGFGWSIFLSIFVNDWK